MFSPVGWEANFICTFVSLINAAPGFYFVQVITVLCQFAGTLQNELSFFTTAFLVVACLSVDDLHDPHDLHDLSGDQSLNPWHRHWHMR